eukprot:270528-Chlamydomonas_euryale.AAC.2
MKRRFCLEPQHPSTHTHDPPSPARPVPTPTIPFGLSLFLRRCRPAAGVWFGVSAAVRGVPVVGVEPVGAPVGAGG